jgi:two-component system phosphate regulon sensor histidine kinase PhoR
MRHHRILMNPAGIRIVAAATTLCLAGLLVLQGHWLWRGYDDARARFDRRIDALLAGMRERIDPGDPLGNAISDLATARDVHSDVVRATLKSIRAKIDLDVARDGLPNRYTIFLTRLNAPAASWTDPSARDTSDARSVQLQPACPTCRVRLGVRFDDVGPAAFLREIRGIVTISVVLVGALVACVVVTFTGLARLRQEHERHIAFVNNLAHELRTPLFSISVASKVLEHSTAVQDAAEVSRQVSIIGRAKHRLIGHVDRLLDLASLESGAVAVAREPVDLNEVVRCAAAVLDVQRDAMGATLRVNPSDDDDVIVLGDARRLEDAVVNLIDNAFKYGGEPARVVVTTKRVGVTCVIEVEDSGAGIPRQRRAEVFEPFVRITNGVRHGVKGFGLGLSQVRAVATQHGGDVAISDMATTGSRFVLTLPAANAARRA